MAEKIVVHGVDGTNPIEVEVEGGSSVGQLLGSGATGPGLTDTHFHYHGSYGLRRNRTGALLAPGVNFEDLKEPALNEDGDGFTAPEHFYVVAVPAGA